jgi:hypothetical protein
MRNAPKAFWIFPILFLSVSLFHASAADDRGSIVVVFKDGHRQTLAIAEIAHIDFKSPSAVVFKDGRPSIPASDLTRIEFENAPTASFPSRTHFIGKWQVGEGSGSSTFYITLESDGQARKSIGPPHGTWTCVDGEARIAWDDGWHDVIRKVGATHEKRAFEPGKSFDDTPSNITAARNTEPKPI